MLKNDKNEPNFSFSGGGGKGLLSPIVECDCTEAKQLGLPSTDNFEWMIVSDLPISYSQRIHLKRTTLQKIWREVYPHPDR